MTFISSQHHSFDIFLAKKYGIEEAIIIHHFQHWIRINRANNRNIFEGRCWTYQTRKDIADHFPYFNEEKVKYATDRLVEAGVLVKGNFNKLKFDKTCWYAFVDEKLFGVDGEISNILYERENSPSTGKIPRGEGKIPKAIPDTIPDTKPGIDCLPGPDGPEAIPKTIKKINTMGKEISLELDEVFRKAVQTNKNWTTSEINEVWLALINYTGRINDLLAYFEASINNLRRKKGLEGLKPKGETECKAKTQHQQVLPRPPTPEELQYFKDIDSGKIKNIFALELERMAQASGTKMPLYQT